LPQWYTQPSPQPNPVLAVNRNFGAAAEAVTMEWLVPALSGTIRSHFISMGVKL
jgi:hypothetical protein